VTDRLDRLRAWLEQALLVSSPINLRYLTGFRSTNAALLVEPDRTRLFTDFRYADAAREVAGVEFVQTGRDLYGSLAGLLAGTLAFEAPALSFAQYESLATGRLELVPTRGLVEALREVKDADELDAIRRAAAIVNEAYVRLAEEPFVGRTERDLARWLELTYLELGAEGLAFDIGLASGPNGANAHGKPGDRTIEAGVTVVVDSGARVDGYQSDCTRTFATGPLPTQLAEAYEVCLEAQELALADVTVGALGRDVDAVARRRIDWAGLAEHFGHGLGHGLGLEVHEGPYLNQESQAVLVAGNVVTVEPGIYLTGVGGIRIEDLVIVGEDGPEVLTSFPKEPVTVGS
jgi:Xaa-Pro aminopeptidase